MPYPPHVKQLAQKLDPECWISYSGMQVSVKQAIDARRERALKQATRMIRNGYREVKLANARIMFSFLKKPFPGPCLEEIRSLVRELVVKHGVNTVRELIRRTLRNHEFRTLREIPFSEYRSVYAALQNLQRNPPIWKDIPMVHKVPLMKISMMLHFSAVIGPYAPEASRTSPSYTRFVKELLRDGLIERPTNAERAKYPGWAYRATEKGRVYVEALTAVQYPVQTNPKWIVPK